jgi:hypothetical protein
MTGESIDATDICVRDDTDIVDDIDVSMVLETIIVGSGRILNSEELATSPFKL